MARDCTIPLQTRTPATYQTEESLSSAILKTSAKPVPDAKAPDASKYRVSYLPSGTPLCPDPPHIGSDDLSTLNPDWDIEKGCDENEIFDVGYVKTFYFKPKDDKPIGMMPVPMATKLITTESSDEIKETQELHNKTYPEVIQETQALLQKLSFTERKRFIMTKDWKGVDMEGVSKIMKLKSKANKARRQAKQAKIHAENFHMRHVNEADVEKREILLKITRNSIIACIKFNENANALWNKAEGEFKIMKAKVSEIMKLKKTGRQAKKRSP